MGGGNQTLNPFQCVTILSRMFNGRRVPNPKPIPVRNQPIHNVQLGREQHPFQDITILSRMFNGRREPNPNPFQSRMFNLDILQV
jgi:hypothetical protein